VRQPWRWQPRVQPLEPGAAVAWGEAAGRLLARLKALPETTLRKLQATAGEQVLIVTGLADDLPWVEGIEYAAQATQAPDLWLPVLWQPDVCPQLLRQALAARYPRLPLLLWPAPGRVVPLDRLLPLSLAHHLGLIEQQWSRHATA
jgi:hypothetical protein